MAPTREDVPRATVVKLVQIRPLKVLVRRFLEEAAHLIRTVFFGVPIALVSMGCAIIESAVEARVRITPTLEVVCGEDARNFAQIGLLRIAITRASPRLEVSRLLARV